MTDSMKKHGLKEIESTDSKLCKVTATSGYKIGRSQPMAENGSMR